MLPELRALLDGDDTPPPWLVPDLLCQGTMVVMAGEAGAGKSLFSYTLAIALSSGSLFMGRQLQAKRVLYFDEENSLPDRNQYLRWAWRGLNRPEIPDANLRLEHFELAKAGLEWDRRIAALASEYSPDLIVIDTATPACHIVDENDNGEASEAIRRLRRAKNCAGAQASMLILKHARLDTESGTYSVRGAKSWVGETDSTLLFTRAAGRPRLDKLWNTNLQPQKVRAFGLRTKLFIQPHWTGEDPILGIALDVGRETTPAERG